MKVSELIEKVRGALGATGEEAQYEGLIAGDGGVEVDRVLVCHTPTVDVLRKAGAEGRKLVISREHPFYSHGTWYAAGTEQALANDEIAAGKRKLIGDAGLAVYRLSSVWDAARPKSQAAALAGSMGWRVDEGATDTKFRGVTCVVEPTTVRGVAELARQKVGARPVRGVGELSGKVTRVSVLPGLVDVPTYEEALRDERVDCVLAGEANEWEGAPYVKDAIDAGRKLGVVYAGFAVTGGPGITAMGRFVAETLKGMDVTWVGITAPSKRAGGTVG